MIIVTMAAIDMSRLTDGRAALQRAVDNAALSGAAAYSVNAAAIQTLAVNIATASFCNQEVLINGGFVLNSGSTANGLAAQSCGNGTGGPGVSAVLGGFVPGTPGAAGGSGCSATNTKVTTGECGFIVTVTASATMASAVPALFGASRKVTVTGVAFNPFIDIGRTFATTLKGSAVNTDTIWLYPVLLTASGQPDFSTNAGAVPQMPNAGAFTADATPSGCTDDPAQTSCGNFTMLADTFFDQPTALCPSGGVPGVPCYPYGLNQAEFIQGVVQNPTAPTSVVTATTPIGIAYESIAGGAQPKNFPSGPTWNEGTPSNPANSSCKYYPGYEVYNSVQQVFTNTDYSTTNTQPAGNYLTTVPSNPTYPYATPLLPWPLVTRWFYSSYLANSYPPSQGEIYSQTNNNSYTNSKTGKITQSYNLDIPSLGNIVANVFTPSETICAPNLRTTPPYQTMPTDGDFLIKTTLPSSGNTNASLFILKQQTGRRGGQSRCYRSGHTQCFEYQHLHPRRNARIPVFGSQLSGLWQ
jgi:hypothetical protein